MWLASSVLWAVFGPESRLLNGKPQGFLKAGCWNCLVRSNLRQLDVHGLSEGLDDVPCLVGVEELVREWCRSRCRSRRSERRGSFGSESRAQAALPTGHDPLEAI